MHADCLVTVDADHRPKSAPAVRDETRFVGGRFYDKEHFVGPRTYLYGDLPLQRDNGPSGVGSTLSTFFFMPC